MNFKKIMATITVAATAFVVGCSNEGSDASGDTSGSGQESDTIKIGSMFELTGSAAGYGNTQNNAVHMAVEEINAAGGVNGQTLEVVEYDTGTDDAQTAQLATSLTSQDQVTAIIGPALTGGFQAAIPVANQAETPIISPSATDDGVLTDAQGNTHPYAYRTGFTNSFQGGALAQFANDELGASKAVILGDNSTDYATGLTETFTNSFDGEIVSVENFTSGQTDFSAVLTNIAEMDFDVLFVPGYYEQAGPIIKQAREMGIDQAIIGPDGFGNDAIFELGGAENMNDIYYTSHFVTESEDPKVQDYVSNYQENFDSEPDMFSGLAYDAVYVVAEAIERAGTTDPVAVNKEIEATTDFDGITGTFSFNEGHDPVKTVSIIEIQENEPVAVHEVDPE